MCREEGDRGFERRLQHGQDKVTPGMEGRCPAPNLTPSSRLCPGAPWKVCFGSIPRPVCPTQGLPRWRRARDAWGPRSRGSWLCAHAHTTTLHLHTRAHTTAHTCTHTHTPHATPAPTCTHAHTCTHVHTCTQHTHYMYTQCRYLTRMHAIPAHTPAHETARVHTPHNATPAHMCR